MTHLNLCGMFKHRPSFTGITPLTLPQSQDGSVEVDMSGTWPAYILIILLYYLISNLNLQLQHNI